MRGHNYGWDNRDFQGSSIFPARKQSKLKQKGIHNQQL